MPRFDGKVALVTGAGSGIGRATSIRLASEGAQVFGVDIDEGGLGETAAEVAADGGEMQVGRFDVADPAQCAAAVQAAVEAFDRLDVLCNIAGVIRASRLEETTPEEWDLMLAVNVSGPFFLAQAAMPHLLATGGNVVNIASNAGLMGQAYTIGYCVAKGGVVQLTRSLAMELAKEPVRVNAVAPGGVETAMSVNFALPPDPDMDLVRRYMGFRGMSQPEDVAAAVVFLASDEASRIHGAILSVDNGLMAG